ncbi:ATP/GTP-binding protein [Echinicola sediminis]
MKTTNKIIALLVAAPLLFWQCGPKKSGGEEQAMEEMDQLDVEDEMEQGPSLVKLWETTEELTTCESVLVDEATGTIYVSNIDGDPKGKDGNGFISIISKDGQIVEKEWLKGLDAPKGMGLIEGKLFVTDIDQLVEVDVASASVSKTYPVEGAGFLNDVDVYNGKVYFSDMATGKIHFLEGGEIHTLAEGQEGINGVRVSGEGVLYGLDGEGLKMYSTEGEAEIVNNVVTGGDGLIILGDGEYLASRWIGEIWMVHEGGEVKLLDTKDAGSNTADIGYLDEEQLVLVPTFKKNKVVAYKLEF